jgi:biopolymer transport protein ExbD
MAGSVGDGEFGFQIAPMLDVLFVLLLFFMVSAGAQKHEASISTQLPGGEPGADITVRVEIDAQGQVTINGQPADNTTGHALPETTKRLQEIVADNPKQPVILTPDSSSRHQRVVDVLNACAGAGVKNLAFGAPPE